MLLLTDRQELLKHFCQSLNTRLAKLLRLLWLQRRRWRRLQKPLLLL
jgi:hypothetical protein